MGSIRTAATISGDVITINGVNDAESTSALCWVGTYEAPTEDTDAYTWISTGDVPQIEFGRSIVSAPTVVRPRHLAYDPLPQLCALLVDVWPCWTRADAGSVPSGEQHDRGVLDTKSRAPVATMLVAALVWWPC